MVHWREEGGQSKRPVRISVLYYNEADGDKVWINWIAATEMEITKPSRPMGRFEQRYIQKSPVTIYYAGGECKWNGPKTDGRFNRYKLSDRTTEHGTKETCLLRLVKRD